MYCHVIVHDDTSHQVWSWYYDYPSPSYGVLAADTLRDLVTLTFDLLTLNSGYTWRVRFRLCVDLPLPYWYCASLPCRDHLLSCQLYWFHPRVARLSVICHSLQWLPHGHVTLYHNMFGTRLLFSSFAEIWRPFCSGRRSLMRPGNVPCSVSSSVVRCWSVTMYRLLQTDFNETVRLSCSSSAIMPPK